MKVALVYDRINKWGGAESVLLALHAIFPEAPLFTSVYDSSRAPWAKVFKVHTSFLQNLPLPKHKHEYYPFLMGPAFEALNFDDFDVVISITSEFAKALLTKPQTLHLCYCLTPTSYLWSGFDHYFSHSPVLRTLTAPLVRYLRFYDRIAAHRPDHYLAISKTVQNRIARYYGKPSEVIYPPVTLPPKAEIKPGTFFLIVSRLVPNKRLDIVVKAFATLGWPLKIVGTGRDSNRLRSFSRSNIQFLGAVDFSTLENLYSSCQAVIVPAEDDFGIVAVEAQGHGKPVIAFRGGGALETIVEGTTGYFFDHHTPKSLITLLKSQDLSTINPQDCITNAQKYDAKRFTLEFKATVTKLWQSYALQHS